MIEVSINAKIGDTTYTGNLLGETSDNIVDAFKKKVVSKLPWYQKGFVKRMSRERFIAEIVSRYISFKKLPKPEYTPNTSAAFICWAVNEGLASFVSGEDEVCSNRLDAPK